MLVVLVAHQSDETYNPPTTALTLVHSLFHPFTTSQQLGLRSAQAFNAIDFCSEVRPGPSGALTNGAMLGSSVSTRGSHALPPQHDRLSRLDPPLPPLCKQGSWCPDADRDEAWLRRKGNRGRRIKSVADDDLDELKACLELGFGFDSPELDRRLSETLPALNLYYAINRQYTDSPSPLGGTHATIFSPGENPQTVKTRLRQWARVVACSVRQW